MYREADDRTASARGTPKAGPDPPPRDRRFDKDKRPRLNVAVILLGAAAVLVFDTIGSLASRHFGFAYSRLMAGSFAIYSAAGFAANAGGWLGH